MQPGRGGKFSTLTAVTPGAQEHTFVRSAPAKLPAAATPGAQEHIFICSAPEASHTVVKPGAQEHTFVCSAPAASPVHPRYARARGTMLIRKLW